MHLLRHFPIRLLTLLILLSPASSAASPPNVVLFLVDDMGLMDSSVPFLTDGSGTPRKHRLNNEYRTPNMEKLAATGIRYSRFYANSVCSPTRASIMTGQSSARHRITQWIQPAKINGGPHDPDDWNWKGLTTRDVTLPRLLQGAGYHTIHCGKGHFGPLRSEGEDPRSIGFDVNIAGGAIGHPASYLGRKGYGHLIKKASHAVPGLESYRGSDTHLSEALTLELNREIAAAVANEKPFFAYMAHYAVHSPFEADQRFVANYRNSGLPGNAVNYATLIEGIDDSLGRILEEVSRLGVADNTLVLFLGDNGSDAPLGDAHGHTSSAPLRGKKGTHYEGGMRVPFIAAWAKPSPTSPVQKAFPIREGVVHDQGMGTILDLFPTVLKVAGLAVPPGHVLDGGSLWETLAGREPLNPQRFLMHFPHSHRSSYFTSYHEGDWKFVRHYTRKGSERHELFHLKEDPFEETNLWDENPEARNRLVASMEQQLRAADAQLPKTARTP